MSQSNPKVCLVGAPLDSGNLGVSALGISFLSAVANLRPDTEVTMFDYGRGQRRGRIVFGDQPFEYRLQGAMHTKRVYRRESFMRIRFDGWLGGLGNPTVRAIRESSAVVDVSGGDSFSDVYGKWRFRAVALPKIIALEQKRPLVLLPQTYGPFDDPECERVAADIINGAEVCWARDAASFGRLRKLTQPERRNRLALGVDMAFALPTAEPESEEGMQVCNWIEEARQQGRPVVGFNVSGLLLNEDANAPEQRQLREGYRQVVHEILDRLLQESDALVVLVPHVIRTGESDITACEQIYQTFSPHYRGRLRVARDIRDPRQAKSILARCHWCCATRMHASLASLSSDVPTAGLAYSDKMQPVFDGCGVGSEVLDLRLQKPGTIVDQLWTSWQQRSQCAEVLAAKMPTVRARARQQMKDIVESAINQKVQDTGWLHTDAINPQPLEHVRQGS